MKKMTRRAAGALALAVVASPAWAQDFPSKSLKLVVPYAPGGNVDISARIIAQPLAEALGLNQPDTLHYQDAMRVQRRSVKLGTPNCQGQRPLQGFLTAGDSRSARWLKTLLQEATPLNWPARQWLMASDAPPEMASPASRQICSCLNAREDAIVLCLQSQNGSEDQRLAGLQSQLRCGTQCGSCVPELRQIIRRTWVPA